MARSLDLTSDWPVPTVAASVSRRSTILDAIGPTDRPFRIASLGKTIVAWTVLLATEEGIVSLDDRVGPDDGHARTVRHLLAHAGGYGFNAGDHISAPERRRMYGNHGIEVAATHLADRAGMSFEEYLRHGILDPLGMVGTEVRGSPAYQMWSTVDDLTRFLGEVGSPRLVTDETRALAVRPQYPGLGGIVPGVGRFDDALWGLGFELRGDKVPHWTGSSNAPTTYGHFGGAGTMMWTDPTADDLSVVALTDRPFDEWSAEALHRWPQLSDAVLDEFTGAAGAS